MSTGNMSTAETVIKHHVQLLVSRNLDSVMEDYTNDSVVFTPNGAFKGLEAIWAVFTEVLGMMSLEVMGNMKVIKQEIDG